MKRRPVVFSEEALDDLRSIYDWIADQSSARAAFVYTERLRRHCLGFDVASERGRLLGAEFPGLRAIGFRRNVTIVFFVESTSVTITRFYRAGRNWERELSSDDD